MIRKSKTSHRKTVRDAKPKPGAAARLVPFQPPNLTPAKRLAQLLKDAEAKGIKPMDEATLEAMGSVWPEDEDIDEFIAWLRESRQEGRY